MRDPGQGVVLVHELGQLAGAEELLDRGHHGADVHQGLRGDRLDVLGRHALTHGALHAGQPRAHLVLNELADGADAPVTEVVDVVNIQPNLDRLAVTMPGDRLISGVQGDQVLDRRDDILDGQCAGRQRRLKAELAVDLVATDLRQVVPLRVEVVVVEQSAGSLGGNLLARAQLLVDVAQRVILALDRVLRDRIRDRRVSGELTLNILAGQPQGLEEDDRRLLALAVDTHAHLVALVDLELQPGAPARDHPRREDLLVGELLGGALEVHARAAHQLRDDDALRPVDDEGALLRHEREVTHEHRLGLALLGDVVLELRGHVERGLIGLAAFLADVHREELLHVEVRVREAQLHLSRVVHDGGHLFEDLLQSGLLRNVRTARGCCLGHTCLPLVITDKPVEALGLQCEQIGDRDRRGDFGERKPLVLTAVLGLGGGCVARCSQGNPPEAYMPSYVVL